MGLLSRILGPSRAGTTRSQVAARYDAAQTSELNRRHWQSADHLSADSALTPAVRQRLRSRARYEAANNGYLAGMTNTRATDLVGTGPRLLLDCGPDADQELVSLVEDNVYEWGQASGIAAKLRTMSIAKAIDGESFAIITNNSAFRGVQLDLRLVEAEMVADPVVRIDLAGAVDGIRYDESGNPAQYYLLDHHPGSTNLGATMAGRWIDASAVLHWYHATRAGQSRGVGEVVPALELFAMLRRYQYAVVTAAETAAAFAAVLKTTLPPEAVAAPSIDAWETMPITRGMMTIAPENWEPYQLKAEQPTESFSAFERRILMQIARSLNLPYIVATMDASGANYSTMRGDYLVYRKHLAAERAELERVVLDPVLARWLDEAALIDGQIPDGLPPRDQWSWRWAWDGHEHVDPVKEATAEQISLSAHTTSLSEVCARRGRDWRQVLRQRAAEQAFAAELGIDLQPAPPQPAPAQEDNANA